MNPNAFMKQFELTVTKPILIFVGIISVFLYLIFSLYFISNSDDSLFSLLISISGFLVLLALLYLVSFGKLNLSSKNGFIYFEWKKRYLFSRKTINPIKIKDIDTIVMNNGFLMKMIIVNKQKIRINAVKPLKNESKMFISSVIQQVKHNNGRVINDSDYQTIEGYNDVSFKIFIISLSFSTLLISRLWYLFEVKSLILVLIPALFYYRHILLRIKKKRSLINSREKTY